MDTISIFLIACGLSMDAFAVAVCQGISAGKKIFSVTIITACFFGFFQAFMPVVGWMAGHQFEDYIISFDHWISFGLLLFLGVRMLVESYKNEYEDEKIVSVNLRNTIILGIATSIDALSAGFTFAFLEADIILASLIIGIVTFIVSASGTVVGYWFGGKFRRFAESLGGIILIFIGIKILLEHIGVL